MKRSDWCKQIKKIEEVVLWVVATNLSISVASIKHWAYFYSHLFYFNFFLFICNSELNYQHICNTNLPF